MGFDSWEIVCLGPGTPVKGKTFGPLSSPTTGSHKSKTSSTPASYQNWSLHKK